MLTIHHLGISQSERVVWLCEELGIPYTLKHYTRDPVTRLAPPELRALHPAGTAPVMTDGDGADCRVGRHRAVHHRPAWRGPAGAAAGAC
jgi:glutathione S-transferase